MGLIQSQRVGMMPFVMTTNEHEALEASSSGNASVDSTIYIPHQTASVYHYSTSGNASVDSTIYIPHHSASVYHYSTSGNASVDSTIYIPHQTASVYHYSTSGNASVDSTIYIPHQTASGSVAISIRTFLWRLLSCQSLILYVFMDIRREGE